LAFLPTGCKRNESNHSAETEALAMAKKSGGKRKKKVETVFLVCEETGDYNYTLRRKTGGEKLKLSKFSPRLRKHTLHVEKKK
jgi:large subunit ribosomal protein L33